MNAPCRHTSNGFSLIEVLVAMTLLVVAITSIAQLSAISARANVDARSTTIASLLAAQKMEQLRALAWSIDAASQPVSDTSTDVTAFPPVPDAGVGLTPSPAESLTANADGYCDLLDAAGRTVRGAAGSFEGAAYVRRWGIAPLPADPADTIVLQVLVTRYPAMLAIPPDAVRLVSVKTRRPT
jgi:prepilin-type N-terminal cleavage/methylation domain-containing protein